MSATGPADAALTERGRCEQQHDRLLADDVGEVSRSASCSGGWRVSILLSRRRRRLVVSVWIFGGASPTCGTLVFGLPTTALGSEVY